MTDRPVVRLIILFFILVNILGAFLALISGGSYQNESSWLSWRLVFSLYSSIFLMAAIFLGGLMLIQWQAREHENNTFKIYRTLPVSCFSALLIRFIAFQAVWSITIIISMISAISIIHLVWTFEGSYSSLIPMTPHARSFVASSLLAMVILTIPIYGLLFVASLIIKRVAAVVGLLVMVLILAIFRFPNWIVFQNPNAALKIIRVIYNQGTVYTLGDLNNLYAFSLTYFTIIITLLWMVSKRPSFGRI